MLCYLLCYYNCKLPVNTGSAGPVIYTWLSASLHSICSGPPGKSTLHAAEPSGRKEYVRPGVPQVTLSCVIGECTTARIDFCTVVAQCLQDLPCETDQ